MDGRLEKQETYLKRTPQTTAQCILKIFFRELDADLQKVNKSEK